MPWPLVTILAAGLALVGGHALAQPGIAPLWLRLQAAVAGGLLVYGLTRSLPRRAQGVSHGSAGFAEAKELTDLLVTPDTRLAPGSVLLGALETDLLALPLDLARQHGVIVGGSGTGKSFSFFLPNAAFAHHTSVVATDPKSELWNRTSGFHRCTRYAPADPEASACLNWIGLCGDARIADLCARALVTAGGETQEPPWQPGGRFSRRPLLAHGDPVGSHAAHGLYAADEYPGGHADRAVSALRFPRRARAGHHFSADA